MWVSTVRVSIEVVVLPHVAEQLLARLHPAAAAAQA